MTESPSSIPPKLRQSSPDQASFSKQSRERVMSDVRYMLRQPSTPWIVFDRSSKPDSTATTEDSAATETSTSTSSSLPFEPFELEAPTDVEPSPSRARVPVICVVVGLLAVLAGVAVLGTLRTLRSSSTSESNAFATTTVAASPAPPVAAVATTETTVTAPAVAEPAARANAPSWLAVRGNASIHRIYLDGKMLLGSGARSFPVKCGTHTIAISDRKNAHEVDVPCGGELVVRE